MKFTKKDAEKWISEQDTKFCRCLREKAKYLVATVLPRNMPHPGLWWEVLKIKNNL